MITGGDLKFYYSGSAVDPVAPADILISSTPGEPERDSGLETTILIAIFTNRRADDDDKLPNKTDTRGGHFSDTVTGLKIGSKLWTLYRANLTTDTLQRAREYIQEALDEQVVDEGLAESVEVTTTKNGNRMDIAITVTGNGGQDVFYRYFLNWQSQIGRG